MQTYSMRHDMIIDVGMCGGWDTEYYLRKGYRVVAIDADPALCERARERFSGAVEEGQLTIVNTGISDREETLVFYRNLTKPAMSSFRPELGKVGGAFEEFPVPCRPLAELIEEHGIPYYMKIDIEGFDEIALRSLAPEHAPAYLSVELSYSDHILEKLQELGYSSFKLINQTWHTTSTEIHRKEYVYRALRKVGRMCPPFRSLIRSLPYRLRARTEWDSPYNPEGWERKGARSGPFGEETHGVWRSFREIKKDFDTMKSAGYYVWWDVHARKPGA